MVTQKVTEKILADAKKEAQEILAKNRTETAEIKKNYDERATLVKKRIQNDVEAAKKIEYLRLVSQKKLELNKKIVAEKGKLINDIIDEALKDLTAQKEYLSFLKALVKQSGRKDGELTISKADWNHYGSDLEKFFKNLGCQFTITTNDEISGGIMIKKDKVVHHGSLNIIRELLKDQLTIAVSKVLI
ncbi:MAG: hypothetical protein WBB67_15645 [bacterium]